MTDNWDRTLFDKDLKAILETKLPVSASKITSLQALATAHPQVRKIYLYKLLLLIFLFTLASQLYNPVYCPFH